MRGGKGEPFIEAVSGGPIAVAGQLHQCAAAIFALCDRPAHHRFADPSPLMRSRNPHRFDLATPRPAARHAGNEAELEAADSSDERRVGTGEVSTCITRWFPYQ